MHTQKKKKDPDKQPNFTIKELKKKLNHTLVEGRK